MLDRDLLERFRFFHKWAGYSTPPGRAVCALNLARAERWAEREQLAVHWCDDEYPDVSWMDEGQLERLNAGVDFLLCAVLTDSDAAERRHGLQYLEAADPIYASLGGIHIGPQGLDDPYCRVVAAELAAEAQFDETVINRVVAD